MKRTVQLLSALLVVLAAVPAAAQTRIVTGRVVAAETNAPLANVQVLVKGTSVGTLTKAGGVYSIAVPAGATTLVFSAPSYGTREVAITGNEVNVQLNVSAVAIEGLVVTALGITREERSIGASVQEVNAEELATVRDVNVVNALAGKVSGVNITNAGPQGGSARVVIRGASSLTGNNQPLFVVDGIPIDNSAPRLRGYGGVDYGNAAQDLNPNDIASVSVLKGPNAAALYGSRAANGAIIITTKSGRGAGGLGITASQNVTFDSPLRLPNYQNQYGQGSGGQFSFVDGNYGGVNDGTDESWGPACNGQAIPQFFSNGEAVPFECFPNNVRDFFETGSTLNTNVSMAASGDRSNVRLSVSRLNQDGIYPGFGLNRTTVSLAAGTNISNRLSADASVQYIAAAGNNRPGVGYDGDNPMLQFVWFGRSVDTRRLREMYNENPSINANWNYSYHSNPYWIALANRNFDNRDRVIGSASASYYVNDWLSATLRSGTDWYEDDRKRTFAAGTIGIDYVGENGAFTDDQQFFQESNTDFIVTATPTFGSDFSVTVNAGAARRDSERRLNNTYVQNLSAPGIFSLSNAAVTPVVSDYFSQKRVNSLYGQAQFGFRDVFFVDVTGRNDWSSTLPDANNSYFYPSVSSSFIFTDAFPVFERTGLLSFGKLRASWARVGNDADPYQLASVYDSGTPFTGFPVFGVSNIIPNDQLRPESTESWEVGGELRFLRDRLTLEGTYYNSATTDQILPVQISPTSGYTTQYLNAGEITNKGVELLATAVPLRLDNGLEWESTLTFAKNNSEVTELYGDLETLVLGTYWSLTVEARKGQPYGALYGFGYQRVQDKSSPFYNQIIVSPTTGRPLRSTEKRVLGNYNPDWSAGLNNRLSFRGLDFSFLIETKQGGDLFSVTNMFGRYSGVLEETLEGREGGLVVDGVYKDPTTGEFKKNDKVVSAERYNHGLYGLHEAHVFDASYVKLREMKLEYALPASLTNRFKISGANIALVGRNLWLSTDVPHIDPETAFDASNAQGLEFGQLPSARSIGFNIKVTP